MQNVRVEFEQITIDEDLRHYLDGRPFTGVVIGNYPNGQLASETAFYGGFETGFSRSWHRNGQIRSDIAPGDDYDSLQWYTVREWHANGQIREIYRMLGPGRAKEVKEWDDSGCVVQHTVAAGHSPLIPDVPDHKWLDVGPMATGLEWLEESNRFAGTELSELHVWPESALTSIPSRTAATAHLRGDLHVGATKQLEHDGVAYVGIEYELFSDGAVKSERAIAEGYPNGYRRSWYRSGQIRIDAEFCPNVSESPGPIRYLREWHPGGKIKRILRLRDFVAVEEKAWNEEGTLTFQFLEHPPDYAPRHVGFHQQPEGKVSFEVVENPLALQTPYDRITHIPDEPSGEWLKVGPPETGLEQQ
ncbi:MAG: hypothetical protein KDA88_23450 [Planctomycetaceae bacterium]|nr:hypothetical protein [Planctomycetaceae bacterium]MCB9950113.1 hypothetical protein [Planctomycetaceae bacterium]